MSKSYRIIELVGPISESQVRDAVQVCTEAYDLDDPSIQALLGGNTDLWGPVLRATVRAAELGGRMFSAVDGCGKTVGLALWWGPGQKPFASEEQRRLGFYDFWNSLSLEAREWHEKTFRPQFDELAKEALGPKGTLPAWWLNYLAVLPSFQRRGIARALINAVREQGADIGLAATNDVNATIYRQIGFVQGAKSQMSSSNGTFPVYIFVIKPDGLA